MELNWTVLTYFIIGLFALSGFFKGWWKEAIVTILLAVLVFLLQNPAIAQTVIALFNEILATLWNFIPTNFQPAVDSTLEAAFAIDTQGRALQANPADPGTWLIILIIVLAVGILFGRSSLPNSVRKPVGVAYSVTPMGGLLGGLLGGLNGFIIINLVREYLDGRNLPLGGPATEIAMAGGRTGSVASSGVAIQAIEVPNFTILDSFLPWIIIGLGLLILLSVIRSRVGLHSKNGYRKINTKVPYGYRMVSYVPPK